MSDTVQNSGYVPAKEEEHAQSVAGDSGPAQLKDVAYVYKQHLDPNRQIDPHGVYLDDVQKRDAEINRARAEGREPDFDNPGPIAGTPLVEVATINKQLPADLQVPEELEIVIPVVVGTEAGPYGTEAEVTESPEDPEDENPDEQDEPKAL